MAQLRITKQVVDPDAGMKVKYYYLITFVRCSMLLN
jgi:hypothetical protein